LLGLGLLLILLVLLGGARLREMILLRLPGFAQVHWASVLARFAHTSALGAFSGVPLPELLAASGRASGSPALTEATRRAAEEITAGESLSDVASKYRRIPALWTCAVQVAGPRGDLPATLAELARTYELRAQQRASAVRLVLGPLLFLLVAAVVGGLIVGVLLVISTVLNTLSGIL
jgi:type IV pilus assembly protein PilC